VAGDEGLSLNIFIDVTEMLRRLMSQSRVLLDIAATIENPTTVNLVKLPMTESPIEDRKVPSNATTFETQKETHVVLDLPKSYVR
jgi:hypothetical protein